MSWVHSSGMIWIWHQLGERLHVMFHVNIFNSRKSVAFGLFFPNARQARIRSSSPLMQKCVTGQPKDIPQVGAPTEVLDVPLLSPIHMPFQNIFKSFTSFRLLYTATAIWMRLSFCGLYYQVLKTMIVSKHKNISISAHNTNHQNHTPEVECEIKW